MVAQTTFLEECFFFLLPMLAPMSSSSARFRASHEITEIGKFYKKKDFSELGMPAGQNRN